MFWEMRRVFLVIILTSCCLGSAVFWMLEGPFSEFECEHEYLPSVASALGFRIGRISVREHPKGPLGFVEIDEPGPMHAAGFRAGDIPMGVHEGGMIAFCSLLDRAALGEEARIVVTTSAHWPVPEPQRRELVVPKPPKRR